MKTVACILLMTFCITGFSQQAAPAAPPTLTQEDRRGEIVCTASRQYGMPDIITISASAGIDISKQDIAGCVNAAKQKLKDLYKSVIQQQNFLKKES